MKKINVKHIPRSARAQCSVHEWVYGAEQEQPGGAIGRGDHRLAPDFVEERTQAPSARGSCPTAKGNR